MTKFMGVTIEAGGLAPNIFGLEIDVISEVYLKNLIFWI